MPKAKTGKEEKGREKEKKKEKKNGAHCAFSLEKLPRVGTRTRWC